MILGVLTEIAVGAGFQNFPRQLVAEFIFERGDFVAITNGLKPKETIVSTGVFKLRNGMPVTINNDLAPKPQVNPTPVDS